MQACHERCIYAVFPFLKTRHPAHIGSLTFRSTDDIDGLSAEQAGRVREIASMLFLRDDLRIRSASYAVVPLPDHGDAGDAFRSLADVQAFVAYCYAMPRHEFGDLFLSPEHASMAVFTPGRVSVSLVRPDFHVDCVGAEALPVADDEWHVQGYEGLYNFRHSFWVTAGSRLYGPMPHLTLNMAQDLGDDIARAVSARADYRLLAELLPKRDAVVPSRALTAVRWFNAANSESNDGASALVDLAIAFEALLGLPSDQKTDRLTDAISLLLGRTPRLDTWARQFYDARSRTVHEGSSPELRFMAAHSRKGGGDPRYQSLLSYGRLVFQLCVGSVLVGAQLAQDAGLEETLVTNQERFERVCRVLACASTPARQRLEAIAPIAAAARQYQYVPESGLTISAMLSAARSATQALLECSEGVSQDLKESLDGLAAARPSSDSGHLPELDALAALHRALAKERAPMEPGWAQAVRDLVDVVWWYVFRHYFWLKGDFPGGKEGAGAQGE
jgi:hypothetical protein